MNDGTLRRVAWRQVLPWLLIFQTPRLALRLPVLGLGFLTVALVPIGWRLAEFLFLDANSVPRGWGVHQWAPYPDAAPDYSVSGFLSTVFQYGSDAFQNLLAKWQAVLSTKPTARTTAYFALGSLWTLAVWSFFGAAICRIAVAQLGCGDRIGIGAATRFARRRFTAVIAAPLMPLVALLFVALLPAALGWLISFGGVVAILGSILWGAALIAGVLMGLLALGVFFGWPLMTPTIAAERNGDSFEALSRAYAYCTQRPLHLFLYAALASCLGGATWFVVEAFFEFLLHSTTLAASWAGASADEFAVARTVDNDSSNAPFHLSILAFWTTLVRCFASGFHFSFLWSAASAIYLLLRRDVDETDFDEVDLEDDGERLPMPQISPAPEESPAKEPSPDAKPSNAAQEAPTGASPAADSPPSSETATEAANGDTDDARR